MKDDVVCANNTRRFRRCFLCLRDLNDTNEGTERKQPFCYMCCYDAHSDMSSAVLSEDSEGDFETEDDFTKQSDEEKYAKDADDVPIDELPKRGENLVNNCICGVINQRCTCEILKRQMDVTAGNCICPFLPVQENPWNAITRHHFLQQNFYVLPPPCGFWASLSSCTCCTEEPVPKPNGSGHTGRVRPKKNVRRSRRVGRAKTLSDPSMLTTAGSNNRIEQELRGIATEDPFLASVLVNDATSNFNRAVDEIKVEMKIQNDRNALLAKLQKFDTSAPEASSEKSANNKALGVDLSKALLDSFCGVKPKAPTKKICAMPKKESNEPSSNTTDKSDSE